MRTNWVQAYCPHCQYWRRFSREDIYHGFHAMLTICTAGLWGVSWLAIVLGHALWPWRCKACGCSAPDFARKQPAASSGIALPAALATPSDIGTSSGITPPKVSLPVAASVPLPEPEAMHAA